MSDMEMSVNEDEPEYTPRKQQNQQTYPKSGRKKRRAKRRKADVKGRIRLRRREYPNARTPDSSVPKRMVDITRDKPIKVTIRVVVPVRDHPKFNFVGKLLGPKGNSLKRLQEDTMTKMAILGRGSMRDRLKEEELRATGDPKFSHLLEELHVEVTAYAPPAEAHARIAYALAEVRRFLVPDYNDEIRQEQMWEMAAMSKGSASSGAAVPATIQARPGSPQAASAVPQSAETGSIGRASPEPEAAATTPMEPPHPQPAAVRSLPIINNPTGPGMIGRKRPLVANPRLAHAMSPTKRTVLGILARARQAQAQQDNQPYGLVTPQPPAILSYQWRPFVGIPGGLRDDQLIAPGNILIN